jgi:outer membrane receptor for ferrienterochelin and colicins
MKRIVFTIIFVLLNFSSAVFAGTLAGRILDSKTGEALPGANVQILGTLRGASADAQGLFKVQNVPPGTFSVRASMIGYKSFTADNVQIRPNRTKVLSIKLAETTIEFDPIVVLAGKSKQRLDQAAVSISVVTSRDIERRNAVNIIEALESAPGVTFIGDQISIRGSTGYTFGAGNKVLLLLDGVPVYASDTGQFNWDMLPPLDIEQIEVLKGAGSTLWGASALGGVVNILTKDPSPEGKLLYSFSVGKYDKPYFKEWEWTDPNRLYYSRQDVSFSKKFKSFGMRISGGRYFSTGYTQLGDFQKYNLTGKFDYRFGNGMKWTGYTAYSFIDRGFFVQWLGQNDPYQVDESNLQNYAETNQLSSYMKLAIPFSSRFGINIRASFVRTLMGNQFGESADFNPALGQGMEIQADWIPYPGHMITFGTQFQLDAGSTRYFGDHKGYFIGPYLQDEWKARENLRLTAGFRYDRYQLVGDLKEDLFSPRFGINWQPWKKTSLRASVGSGFRAATIVERFLELSVMNFKIKANPLLKAESSWAYDVGFRQYITDEWNIDISLFDNEYRELIEAHLDLIRGLVQFRNIPRARIQGVEVTMNMNFPLSLLGQDLSPGIQASLTAMDHKDLDWNGPLPYRPKVIATVRSNLNLCGP